MDATIKTLANGDTAAWQSRYSSLQQRLFDTSNRLDLALSAFRRVNEFFSSALHLEDPADVPALATEAVVDILGMEFGILVPLGGGQQEIPHQFGISLGNEGLTALMQAIESALSGVIVAEANQLAPVQLGPDYSSADLRHAIFCYCLSPGGSPTALLVCGNTRKGARFYNEPSNESLEVLTLYARQVGALISALQTRAELRKKQLDFERSESLRLQATRAQVQAEIIAQISVSPALVDGRLEILCSDLVRNVSERLGIARASIWLMLKEGFGLRNSFSHDCDGNTSVTRTDLSGYRSVRELQEMTGVRFLDASTPGVEGGAELGLQRTTAVLDAVIRVAGEAVGVLRLEQVEADFLWDEGDFSFACLAADQIALCLSNIQRQETEAALEEAAAEATALAKIAEAANRAKSEFLASMSHELRTPLHAVLALTEGLLEETRGPVNPRQRQALEIVSSSGRHLLSIINDVLDLAKVEAGRLEIVPEMTLLSEVCEASLAMVKELAAGANIRLEFSLCDERLQIRVDSRRLKQILVNLLSNAIKFTPPGGQAALEVHAVPEQAAVAISVVDTGIGISPEDLGRLFTPFTQIDAGLNRSREGTGLGLSLVRRLVELHGGRVTAESNPGHGSRFTVWLPTSQTPLSIPITEGCAHAAGPVTPGPGDGHRVLLAEDNEQNRQAIADFLGTKGFEVLVACDGRQAIEQLATSCPEVILMDMQMPVMDGLSATRRMREDPRLARVPVIGLGADSMPGDQERCLASGMNDYLAKPVPLSLLLERILGALEAIQT